jgi:serine/threonine-protein kinase
VPELSTGTIVDGRYKVLSRLGAGGMADVFLAEDQQLGRKVALKLLHRRFAEDPDFVERFRREAQSAAGLQHPNVVSVYDRGAYDGTYYIAMEYLPGRSLKQLIRQEAPLDPVRAIDLTIQVLKAARFAHRRGVIHRDLKPHNVLVDDSDHAKVTDFGIARAGASDMTETGSIMGTAQYLSPEQAQGHAVGATSDLYSVGVVLYELLTGRLPFDAESAVTIALRHVSEAPAPPTAINPAIPPELEQVVLWALNKNPADRPADADQFITVLERVKESIVSGARGQRTASMAAVTAIPPLPEAPVHGPPTDPGTGSFAPAPQPWDGNGELPPEAAVAEAEDRRRRWLWATALLVVLLLAGAGVAAYLLTRPDQRVVPKVVGESVKAAQANIQNAGFTPNLIYRNDTSKPDTVIDQSPLSGVKANTGSTVTLTVSQGRGSVSVPPVNGLTEAAARRALRKHGLKVSSVQTESSPSVPSGHATRTDPASGYPLPAGSAITLYISSGKAKVQVPDVTGQTQASAKSNLIKQGFAVTTTTQTSNTATPGNVIAENPPGGTSVAPGSTITITVATAPTTAKVPSVVGKAADAATSQLLAAGFKVATQIVAVAKPGRDGKVLKQNPQAGTTARKASTVTLTVGKYTAPVTPTTPTGTTTTPTTPTGTTTTPTTPAK